MLRAAVWYRPNEMRVEEVEEPKINAQEVLLKVKYCGICGTDLHAFTGEVPAEWLGMTPPIVFGHEFSAQVEEVGKEVRSLQKGDNVGVDPMYSCGTCVFCRRGDVKLCPTMRTIGYSENGAFAQYCKARSDLVYRLPADVSLEAGALLEPISVSYHTIERAQIQPGTSVGIIGSGSIGLILLQLAKAAGAYPLIITDILHEKLEIAKKLGADFVLNSKEIDLAKEVKNITDGNGLDVCIEAVGNGRTYEQAISLVGTGGRAVLMGFCPEGTKINLDFWDLMQKEATIKLSRENPFTFAKAINAIKSGRVNAKALISHVFPLEEVVKGFESHKKEAGKTIKVLVKP